MKVQLSSFLKEVSDKTTVNDQYPVLTSSKAGLFLQSDYFNKQVASRDNIGYKIIRRGQFTYRAMSDTGEFFPNMLECADIGIVSPAYPVFEITKPGLILSDYLKFFFKSDAFQHSISAFAQGSTRTSIKFSKMQTVDISLPSIEEQRKIVNVLKRALELVTARETSLSTLDSLIKARFVEMFGDCRTNPYGWRTTALADIAEVGSSKRVFVEELKESGIPFYRGTEIGVLAEGKAIQPELFITPEHYHGLIEATGKPQPGDLLMPSICPDGRIWVVDTTEPFYFKDGRVLWVHSIRQEFDPVFLLYTLKDRIMTDYSSIASGTTFAELKIFALKQCQVFDVPIEKQKRFADFIRQVDKSKFSKMSPQRTGRIPSSRRNSNKHHSHQKFYYDITEMQRSAVKRITCA